MIQAFNTTTHQFAPFDAERATNLPAELLWLDLDSPSQNEEKALEQLLGFELLTAEEMKDIEPSSRLFQENGVTYMTATLVARGDTDEPETVPVSFLMFDNRLITIRFAQPRAFGAFQAHVGRYPQQFNDGASLFTGLMEALIDRNAELLERMGADLDSISRSIFVPARKGLSVKNKRPSTEQLQEMLVNIAYSQNLIFKVRESLVSLGRMVSYFVACEGENCSKTVLEHVEVVRKDIASLTEHASYLTGSITFLLDSCMGFINIEQNAIIKIFSVASVIFLPPMLVASIYGMNFKAMPELNWALGYPFALLLMVLSAVLPYMFFKKKGWF